MSVGLERVQADLKMAGSGLGAEAGNGGVSPKQWSGFTIEDVSKVITDKYVENDETKTRTESRWAATSARSRRASCCLFKAALVLGVATGILVGLGTILSGLALPILAVGLAAGAFGLGAVIACIVRRCFHRREYKTSEMTDRITRCFHHISVNPDEPNKPNNSEFYTYVQRKLVDYNKTAKQGTFDFRVVLGWMRDYETPGKLPRVLQLNGG